MILSELSPAELVERLSAPGLCFRSGPFVVDVQTPLNQVADGIQRLYQDCPLENGGGFVDFHIRLDPPRSLRRWYHPQVICSLNLERPFAPLPLNFAFAMFESSFNWAIYTGIFNFLLIHAASVERNGYAAILPAPPGSGKSTLCAALVNRGWRLLTDELTLISPETETILPLARPISLKNDAIHVIGDFAPEATFGPETRDTVKGTIAHMRPPTASVERMDEPAVPAWLIFPKYEAGATTRINALGKAQAFMRLPSGLVNYPILGELGFRLLTNLIDRTACYEFVYSDLEDAIAWFDQLTPRTERTEDHRTTGRGQD